ncbi:MAG: DegT/DnrJ/EryC1/StrS family aminotransferase [Bryobacterales bacterium]|nr:DegT/DnrJ/EryC1/StrS family aminotransferase [Bryobacterales bacterium]
MAEQSTTDSRRQFLQTGATGLVTLGVAGQMAGSAASETLALSGGPRAVTFPNDRHSALTRWPRYGAAEKKALHDLVDSGNFYQELPAFEKEWQAYTKSPFVKSHMNCTSALTSMYFALDLPPGSEIMVPSYTFFATCLAMRFFGLVPIFIDIDPKTACFDLDDAKRKLTSRTKAMVPMHSWGLPCEMDHIAGFAKEKGLIVLEDAAHAHGASMQGKKMGTWGSIGCYSFQASKVLPTVEGGMGMYQTREYYERATAFGHYEAPPTFPASSPVRAYDGTGFGQKFRMHPFAAVVGRQQLRGLDERNQVVENNVRRLNSQLTDIPGVTEPRIRSDQKRSYYYADMLLIDWKKFGVERDPLLKALKAEGVRATMWDYPEQHKMKIYAEAKWWHHTPQIPPSMPGNASINAGHIFMPLFYGEADDLIEQYANAFRKVWAHRAELKV